VSGRPGTRVNETKNEASRLVFFLKTVMPAHRRSKNGVASLAYAAGIHVLSA
jgi:hypothetical protein